MLIKEFSYRYLDFQKVFDGVLHKRLTENFRALGLTGRIANWLGEWLSNRQQRVIVNGFFLIGIGRCPLRTMWSYAGLHTRTSFYRAMHVVLARYCYRKVVRPSVRLSVCNVAVRCVVKFRVM